MLKLLALAVFKPFGSSKSGQFWSSTFVEQIIVFSFPAMVP